MGTEVVGPLLRRLAGAFVLGTVLVLAIDALLHLALSAIRDDAMAAPWWINARVVERTVWVIAATLGWWASPWLAASLPARPASSPDAGRGFEGSPPLSTPDANRLVGTVMIVVPLLWFLATLIAFAVNVTLQGDWAREGARLLEPYVYSEALLANAPWLLAGATLIVVARHLPRD